MCRVYKNIEENEVIFLEGFTDADSNRYNPCKYENLMKQAIYDRGAASAEDQQDDDEYDSYNN